MTELSPEPDAMNFPFLEKSNEFTEEVCIFNYFIKDFSAKFQIITDLSFDADAIILSQGEKRSSFNQLLCPFKEYFKAKSATS